MQQKYIICANSQGNHKMAYTEWGENKNQKVLICVHGLTRHGRDFEILASLLAANYRVICPDIVGRGNSDWLEDPNDYNLSVYVQDILTLLTELKLEKVDWIGTSMGGLIGMFIASKPASPIQRLVINDVGPFISEAAMRSIAKYLLFAPRHFANFKEVEEHVRLNSASWGLVTDAQWQHFAQNTVKLADNGSYYLHYDPQIASRYQPLDELKELTFWEIWESINCPILLLHGEESKLLLPETIAQMQESKPQMEVIHFPGVGHAPALMESEQIQVIKHWLLQ